MGYQALHTDILRDGMMQGVNVGIVSMARSSSIPIIASGGITNIQDIIDLYNEFSDEGMLGAITGRAIYEKTLDLAEAQKYCDNL